MLFNKINNIVGLTKKLFYFLLLVFCILNSRRSWVCRPLQAAEHWLYRQFVFVYLTDVFLNSICYELSFIFVSNHLNMKSTVFARAETEDRSSPSGNPAV